MHSTIQCRTCPSIIRTPLSSKMFSQSYSHCRHCHSHTPPPAPTLLQQFLLALASERGWLCTCCMGHSNIVAVLTITPGTSTPTGTTCTCTGTGTTLEQQSNMFLHSCHILNGIPVTLYLPTILCEVRQGHLFMFSLIPHVRYPASFWPVSPQCFKRGEI